MLRLHKYLLFFVAAFSMTQIHLVGFIGISELVMLVCGPFVLLQHYRDLKKAGFLSLLLLAGLWFISALATDLYRQTPYELMLRGLAPPLVILFVTPCLFSLMHRNILVFKWGVVGFVATAFLSVFFIQTGSSIANALAEGITAREAAVEYKLTFISLVKNALGLVPSLYFLSFPALSIILTVGLAVLGLFQGGRSIFLVLCVSAGMMIMVYGKAARMRRISKKIIMLSFGLLLLTYVAKETYEYAAVHEYLGAKELEKYEQQSDSRIGLLSGRSHFIHCIYAIRDSPVLGHGSWARDVHDYRGRALAWLGDAEALDRHYRHLREPAVLSGHSHIMTSYIWNGLGGAIFWIYVLVLLYKTIRYRLGLVPELYGYLALVLPAMLWNILFSPFGGRVMASFIIVICLLLRYIEKQMKHGMQMRRRLDPVVQEMRNPDE